MLSVSLSQNLDFRACQALRIARSSKEVREDPDLGRTQNLHGQVCALQGKHQEALDSHALALGVLTRTLGADHADVADTLELMGSVYWAQKKEEYEYFVSSYFNIGLVLGCIDADLCK